MSNTGTETRSDLRSEYNMACPQCGQADTLSIEIVCTAILSIDGTEPDGEHFWDRTSPCFCPDCDLYGTVADFTQTGSGAEKTAAAKLNSEVAQ
jgi:hypothetical protein